MSWLSTPSGQQGLQSDERWGSQEVLTGSEFKARKRVGFSCFRVYGLWVWGTGVSGYDDCSIVGYILKFLFRLTLHEPQQQLKASGRCGKRASALKPETPKPKGDFKASRLHLHRTLDLYPQEAFQEKLLAVIGFRIQGLRFRVGGS